MYICLFIFQTFYMNLEFILDILDSMKRCFDEETGKETIYDK